MPNALAKLYGMGNTIKRNLLDIGYGDVLGAPRARREDGTPKGEGWLGSLHRPDGGISTELSFDFHSDGRRILAPLLVPTLSQDEVRHLLGGGKPTDEIYRKSIAHAMQQMHQGRGVFK